VGIAASRRRRRAALPARSAAVSGAAAPSAAATAAAAAAAATAAASSSRTASASAAAAAAAAAATAAWRGAAARHRTALLRIEVVRLRDDSTHSEACDGVPVRQRSKIALSVRKVSSGVAAIAIAHGTVTDEEEGRAGAV
jgi:hypothetical protein